MEHRLQKRRPIRVKVGLAKKGEPIGSSRTIDISRGGVGIEPPQRRLRAGELVEIDLPRPIDPVPERKLRAVVIHRKPGLVGLMFVSNPLWNRQGNER